MLWNVVNVFSLECWRKLGFPSSKMYKKSGQKLWNWELCISRDIWMGWVTMTIVFSLCGEHPGRGVSAFWEPFIHSFAHSHMCHSASRTSMSQLHVRITHVPGGRHFRGSQTQTGTSTPFFLLEFIMTSQNDQQSRCHSDLSGWGGWGKEKRPRQGTVGKDKGKVEER